MNKLKDFIEKIQTENKFQILSEEATKQSIILPILQLLGWEVFDTDEVYPEFSIESTRVDYALRNGQNNKVFIEVKRINEDIEKHQEQLLTYSFRQGVNLSILTNGILWWFYLPLQEGSWDQRKFYAIDMHSQDIDNIAEVLTNFLAKINVFSGEALENAKRLYGNKQKNSIIDRNIPKAWKKLLKDGDELLIELLAETTENICGYKPNNDKVSEYLFSIANQKMSPSINPNQIHQQVESITKEKQKTPPLTTNDYYSLENNFTSQKIGGFIFLGQKYEINKWRNLLLTIVDIIYNSHKVEFQKITTISGKKAPYFTENQNMLRSPIKISTSSLYAETNLSANLIIKIIRRILVTFNYNKDDVKIILRNN